MFERKVSHLRWRCTNLNKIYKKALLSKHSIRILNSNIQEKHKLNYIFHLFMFQLWGLLLSIFNKNENNMVCFVEILVSTTWLNLATLCITFFESCTHKNINNSPFTVFITLWILWKNSKNYLFTLFIWYVIMYSCNKFIQSFHLYWSHTGVSSFTPKHLCIYIWLS